MNIIIIMITIITIIAITIITITIITTTTTIIITILVVMGDHGGQISTDIVTLTHAHFPLFVSVGSGRRYVDGLHQQYRQYLGTP
jgi:hypothetical protein